jgi:ubiquinone/menaquinone biosynthesis C-methylase UbiE
VSLEERKRAQAQAWSAAAYEGMADITAGLHDHLVERLAPAAGERFLDVATGTGAVALRAARAGARVTGVDIAPGMIDTARRLAGELALDVRFEVGDAEALAVPDATFDVVCSAIGAVFAPDHAAVARELARVTRPGGRLGLVAWRPNPEEDAVFAPFRAPAPGGDPDDWGREDYVADRLGAAFALEFEEGDAPEIAATPDEVWDRWMRSMGPVKTLAESLDPERREALRARFLAHCERHRDTAGVRLPNPYLLILGRRRG